MKAVLISIRPEWARLILNGKKTIEVRKTRPKLETPFKCFIYCTQGSEKLNVCNIIQTLYKANGTVIGEFMCNEIQRYARYGLFKEQARYMKSSHGGYPATEIHYSSLQLSPDALEQYGKGAQLYGWHISDLVIYDDPKKLSEFTGLRKTKFGYAPYEITRPPQSWCYVESLEGGNDNA